MKKGGEVRSEALRTDCADCPCTWQKNPPLANTLKLFYVADFLHTAPLAIFTTFVRIPCQTQGASFLSWLQLDVLH